MAGKRKSGRKSAPGLKGSSYATYEKRVRTYTKVDQPYNYKRPYVRKTEDEKKADQKEKLKLERAAYAGKIHFATDLKDSHYSKTEKFSGLDLCEPLLTSLHTVMRREKMSHIQVAAYPHIVAGKDVLIQSPAQSGKVLSYLLPVCQQLSVKKARSDELKVLIVTVHKARCQHIVAEARQLLQFSNLKLAAAFPSGTRSLEGEQKTMYFKCQILVATLDRIFEHKAHKDFALFLSTVDVLVIDGADEVLDFGRANDVEEISKLLKPKEGRQTVYTTSDNTSNAQKVVELVGKTEFELVSEATAAEANVATVAGGHEVLIAGVDDQARVLISLLKEHKKSSNPKIVVYFTVSRICEFYVRLLREMGWKVLDGSDRLKPAAPVAQKFRDCEKGVLLTVVTPLSPFQDVRAVFQVGATRSKNEYFKRLGSAKYGVCILSSFEEKFFEQLEPSGAEKVAIPITHDEEAKKIEDSKAQALAKLENKTEDYTQTYEAYLKYYDPTFRDSIGCKSSAGFVKSANLYFQKLYNEAKPPKTGYSVIQQAGLKKSGVKVNLTEDQQKAKAHKVKSTELGKLMKILKAVNPSKKDKRLRKRDMDLIMEDNEGDMLDSKNRKKGNKRQRKH